MVESRRLARPALRGQALLRQADPHLLADGRRDGGASARRRARRGSCRCWPRSASCSPRPGSGRCSSTAARRSPGPSCSRRRSPSSPSRAWRCRTCCSRCWSTLAVALAVLAYRPGAPRCRGPAARGRGRPRLRHQGPDRASCPRPRRPAAAVGEPAPAARPGGLAARSRLGALAFAVLGLGWFVARLPAARRRSRSPTSSCARTSSASPARPTTSGGPSGSTCRPTSPRACPGRPSCRSRSCACCARADAATSGASRASCRSGSLARARAAEPLARQDRLLPAAALPGGLAAGRPLPRRDVPWGARRPRLGPASSCSRRRRRSRSSSRGRPSVPGRVAARRPSGARRAGGGAGGRRARCSSRPRSRPSAAPRARRARPRVVAAAWLSLVVFFLPAFSASQPNREIVRDVARERQLPARTCAWPTAPTRRACGATCCSRCASRRSPSATSGASPAPASRSCCSRPPPQDASFRVDPRYRAHRDATATCRPRRSPSAGSFSLRAPGEIMLGANFADRDPEAAVQEEARVPQDARPGGAGSLR